MSYFIVVVVVFTERVVVLFSRNYKYIYLLYSYVCKETFSIENNLYIFETFFNNNNNKPVYFVMVVFSLSLALSLSLLAARLLLLFFFQVSCPNRIQLFQFSLSQFFPSFTFSFFCLYILDRRQRRKKIYI